MGAAILKRILFTSFFIIYTIVVSSCGNGTAATTAATSFACVATATLISGSEYDDLNVTISNGVAPYTLTLPLTGSSPVTTSTTTYSYSTTFTASSTTVTIVDSSNNSTSCVINGSTTGTTSGTIAVTGNINVTGTPNPPVLGSPVTLTATDQLGIGNATFSYVLASVTSGVTLSGSGATAVVLNSTQSSVVLSVYEYVSGSTVASATATVTLTYSGTSTTTGTSPTMLGSISCALYNYGSSTATYYPNQQIDFTVIATTYEPVEIYELIPGTEAWSPGFTDIPSLTNEWTVPFELTFSTAGSQTIQVWAQSITRPGYLCNSGQPMTGVITIY